MTLEGFIGIVISLIYVYLLWEQNRLLKAQNQIMQREEGSEMADLPKPSRLKSHWPILAMLGLTLLTGAAVLFNYYHNSVTSSENWEKERKSLEEMRFKSYSNGEVELDGKRFENCTFSNVTFVYRGKLPFVMGNSIILGKSNIKVLNGPQGNGVIALLMIYNGCRSNPNGDLRNIFGRIDIIDSDGKPLLPEGIGQN
jgi:hypothetical protein